MHLFPREDAHEGIFARYAEMLARLGTTPGGKVDEADLRCFEKVLLKELGYGLSLDHDSEGKPIVPDAYYTYLMEQGPVRLEHAEGASQVICGQSLLDLEAENFAHPRSRSETKMLMRTLIGYYLSGKELQSRKIFRELQEL